MANPTLVPTVEEIYRAKRDMNDINTFTHSTADTFTDSEGENRLTINGVILSSGFYPVSGSFEAGGTITKRNQVLQRTTPPEAYFSWGGTIPPGGLIIPPGSTVAGTGGEGVTAWTNRNDATLASALIDGTQIIGGKTAQEVADLADRLNDGSALINGQPANKLLLKPLNNPVGSSKEESRALSEGVNWISTMRQADADTTSGAAGFNNSGTFKGDGLSNNFAAWGLPFTPSFYACQARMQWTGSNNNCLIGYNAMLTGSTDAITFISVGFASTGFVFNDKITLDVLVPSASLTTGFYNVTMMYNASFYFVSIQKEGTTKAKTFIVTKTLAVPSNAQIGCYAAGDIIRDFRFCATKSKNPWVAPFGGNRSMSTPISIPASNSSGVQISVHLPANYDARITHRLAVYFHGSGGTDKDLWDYDNENTVLSALIGAGYVVMSVNYSANAWGNQESISQNLAAIQSIKDRYNVFERPYFVMQSMGGMVGFNTILVNGIIPASIAAIYPAVNLRWCYDNGFSSAIEGAFSFSGSANFDAATAGYDVLNDNNPIDFAGLKMKIWHSYADTVVSRAQNTDLLKIKAESGGAEVTVITSSGEHGDPSSFDGAGIVDFFRGA